jgi:hypothetical protein
MIFESSTAGSSAPYKHVKYMSLLKLLVPSTQSPSASLFMPNPLGSQPNRGQLRGGCALDTSLFIMCVTPSSTAQNSSHTHHKHPPTAPASSVGNHLPGQTLCWSIDKGTWQKQSLRQGHNLGRMSMASCTRQSTTPQFHKHMTASLASSCWLYRTLVDLSRLHS